MPAVDLEARVAELFAGFGEVGERLRAVQAARLVLAVIGAGVGRQAGTKTAQQTRDRRAVLLAGEVPQRDVERAMAHVVVGAQLALEIVVDLLAALGIAAEQMRGEHDALGHRGRGAHPVGDVFADEAVVGADAHGVAAGPDLAALLVDPVADPLGAVLGQAEVRHLVRKAVDLDPVDPAHLASPGPAPVAAGRFCTLRIEHHRSTGWQPQRAGFPTARAPASVAKRCCGISLKFQTKIGDMP